MGSEQIIDKDIMEYGDADHGLLIDNEYYKLVANDIINWQNIRSWLDTYLNWFDYNLILNFHALKLSQEANKFEISFFFIAKHNEEKVNHRYCWWAKGSCESEFGLDWLFDTEPLCDPDIINV